ncbi:Sugar phosphate permease [bacterium A37T11]|nr:Sugar phosphate permease [bacterium A37T11]
MKTTLKWEPVILLFFAFFVNQADRQIFSVVLPLIKTDLQLSDAQLGLIASALIWAYGLFVPVAGFLGDRFSRRNIIGICLLFWSSATLFTGLCHTVVQLVLLRGIATGGGEAFYAPAANAYISERYRDHRSFALSLHQSAVYFGIILSGLIAGKVAELYGWRHAFYSFGAFGILIAAYIFIRIPKDQPVPGQANTSIIETLRGIVRKPTVYLLTLAFGCMVFVNVGYLMWMPTLIIEKFHVGISTGSFQSMLYHHIGAFLGVVIGGVLTDYLARRNTKWRLITQALSLLMGAPFIYMAGVSESANTTYTALFFFGIFRGVYDANIFASLFEVVAREIRSSASGLMLMMAFLVGSFSPWLMGIVKPLWGLSHSFSLLSIVYLLGASSIFVAIIFFFRKDSVKTQQAVSYS